MSNAQRMAGAIWAAAALGIAMALGCAGEPKVAITTIAPEHIAVPQEPTAASGEGIADGGTEACAAGDCAPAALAGAPAEAAERCAADAATGANEAGCPASDDAGSSPPDASAED